MKLKTLLLVEMGMSMSPGSLTSRDTELRPMPGSADDAEVWDGIKEGNGWFVYRETTDNSTNRSGATAYITDGDKPHKIWIKIKTHGLRKTNDTNKMYRERINKHSNKVMTSWMNAAKRLYKGPGFNEVGNKMTISWKDAFVEAVKDPKVKQYIDNWGESEISDPINFTPRI
jgi:hypothetical protein